MIACCRYPQLQTAIYIIYSPRPAFQTPWWAQSTKRKFGQPKHGHKGSSLISHLNSWYRVRVITLYSPLLRAGQFSVQDTYNIGMHVSSPRRSRRRSTCRWIVWILEQDVVSEWVGDILMLFLSHCGELIYRPVNRHECRRSKYWFCFIHTCT